MSACYLSWLIMGSNHN